MLGVARGVIVSPVGLSFGLAVFRVPTRGGIH